MIITAILVTNITIGYNNNDIIVRMIAIMTNISNNKSNNNNRDRDRNTAIVAINNKMKDETQLAKLAPQTIHTHALHVRLHTCTHT